MKHITEQIVLLINSIIWFFNQTLDVDTMLSRLSLTVTIILGLTTIVIKLLSYFKKGKDIESK